MRDDALSRIPLMSEMAQFGAVSETDTESERRMMLEVFINAVSTGKTSESESTRDEKEKTGTKKKK